MVRHISFFNTYNFDIYINGGAVMFVALCATGILGFIEFLKSAVFVVRIYSRK